jgi:hypothetical protein
MVPLWFETMSIWIWFVPAAFFFRTGIKLIEGWATSEKQYKVRAVSETGKSAVTIGSRITFGKKEWLTASESRQQRTF